MRLGPRPRRPRVKAVLRRGWATATYGARRPGRRMAGLALCGVVSGLGESLVVVLVVGLVSRDVGSRLPLIGVLPGTWTLAGSALGVLGLLALAHAGSAWIAARSASDVQETVQTELMTAYLDAPWSTQSAVRTGELQELVTVRAQILAYGTQEAAQALSSFLNLLVVVVVAVALSAFATVGLLLAVGTVIALSVPLRRLRRRSVQEAAEAQSALAVELTEMADLSREARVFGVADVAARQISDRIGDAARRQSRVRLAASLTPPLTRDATVGLLVVALAIVVTSGPAASSVLGSAVVLVLRSLSHAQSLSAFGTRWTEREEGVERIRRRLDAWRAPGARGTRPCPPVRSLAVHDAGFTYPGRVERALNGVDLELRRGELVGVVGRTAGGKSTLAGVLLGLLVPETGAVRVDGTRLTEIDPREWHRRTAWVGQEPRLLTGTVAHNIAFLREDIDASAIERAARAAGLEGELALDQPVGPGGAALSGGQRQRLALARALAGDPDVVVLDEPTSALDVHTEEVVRDALDSLREDRIVVAIAHRLSTVRTCDRLVVMDAGRVSVVGAPERVARGDETWLREALVSAGPASESPRG